jgi:hypothetical protein
MLSYLACAAQRLPVVYMPRAGVWVSAAKKNYGDAFFLCTLLEQNAGECDCGASAPALAASYWDASTSSLARSPRAPS